MSKTGMHRAGVAGRRLLGFASSDTTLDGYRDNDARYLIGEILWKQGRVAETTHWWSGLRDPSPADAYFAEYSRIVAMMRASNPPRLDAQIVAQIFNAERGRWLSFSATRLRQFGHHFDTN